MTRHRWTWPRPVVLAACTAAYSCVAVLFTWPLARHFSTKLMGLPGSDLGVYVWNLWVFRHEIMAGRSPLSTTSILSLDAPAADLSLHNYTIFSDLLAVPMLPLLGIVSSHNLLILFNLVVAAVAMFLLALHVVRRPGIAWLAGLLFGFSPMLLARSEIHPSLAAAAPLPLFLFTLFRLEATRSPWWALAGGATVSWAAVCDPYYAVYCAVIAAWFLWTRAVRVRRSPWTWTSADGLVHAIDGAIVGLGLLIAFILVTGGAQLQLGPLRVSATTLYTPNMLLVLAVAVRVLLTIRPRFELRPPRRWLGLVKMTALSGGVAAVLLSPILLALVNRWVEGRLVATPLYWRTSTPGADLVTLFLPNPNHPWFGLPWREWLSAQPGGYAENVTSVTLVATVVILAAIRSASFRIPRFWSGLAAIGGLLTLGPFLRVAGIETYLPAPWAVLRYVPVLGAARTPPRFAVLLMLAVSVLFALALKAIAERQSARQRMVMAFAGLALVVELCPAPRVLHDGTAPAIYAQIAADPRDVRVLELPFGVRDGLSSFGNFSAASQFHQTAHGKRLIGGYLSRVSSRRVEGVRRRPVLAVMMALSEGRPVSQAEMDEAVRRAPTFVHAVKLGYVVVDRSRATTDLADAAISILDLEKIGAVGQPRVVPSAPVGPGSRGDHRPRRAPVNAAGRGA